MTLPLRIKFEALCEIFIQSEIGKVKMTILTQNPNYYRYRSMCDSDQSLCKMNLSFQNSPLGRQKMTYQIL